MNLLYTKPDNTLILTTLAIDIDPYEYDTLHRSRGDIPDDWKLVATNIKWPDNGWSHESLRWSGTDIIVDILAAKEETKKILRQEREVLFSALDVQFMRNWEQGLDNSKIVAEKERLRNITNLVDEVNTLQELKNIRL